MFLFIAYKPQSEDYACGHCVAHYSAEFFIQNNLMGQTLIKVWAEYLQRNLSLDYNETGFDFWIFKDGIKVFEEQSQTWDGYDDKEYSNALQEQEDSDEELLSGIYNEASSLAKVKHEAKKELENKEKEEFKVKEEAKALEARRSTFEKLKKEFGV